MEIQNAGFSRSRTRVADGLRVVYIDELGARVAPSMGDPISDNSLAEIVNFMATAIEHAGRTLGIDGFTAKIEWGKGVLVIKKFGNRVVAILGET